MCVHFYFGDNMKKIVEILKKSNKKALNQSEIPVSAVIVRNNKVISCAYNNRNKKNDVLGHAEIIVIKKASKKLKTWILDDCEMYVTLEPCNMCKEIIKQSRIKKVNYFLENNKKVNYKTEFNLINTENSDVKRYFESEIKKFFENMR